MTKITNLTLLATLDGIKNQQFSEEELNVAYLNRINQYNPTLNAYLGTCINSAGIPVAIKDIISTKGIRTTAGSRILENYIPPYDATVIEKLYDEGCNIMGKVNCDEFALGSSGENSAYSVAKNPWDITKVPGGSSSGSAVAVAADLCVFALGTDTGGSIRQPASLCGVVGFKPSYGRVSRYGAIAMSSSLDQIGPFTKTVSDAKKVMEWISGPDGFDSNCILNDLYKANPELKDLKGVKVGVPTEYFEEGLDKGVEKVIKEAIQKLEDLGAEIIEISLPNTKYAVAVYYIIMASELSSNLARFDGIRFGEDRSKFGAEAKRRIMLGTFSLSSGYYDAYFTKAAKVRNLIIQDFKRAFERVDVIVGPVSPTVAWNIGEKINDPLKMYLSDAYTIPASLAGLPGLSVPCGFSEGLPVGLQILGKHGEDSRVLDIGEAYENACEWKEEKPSLD